MHGLQCIHAKKANMLFVIFQNRCFLHLNPKKGSKRIEKKGKKHIINLKVLSLVNLLKDYESPWSLYVIWNLVH